MSKRSLFFLRLSRPLTTSADERLRSPAWPSVSRHFLMFACYERTLCPLLDSCHRCLKQSLRRVVVCAPTCVGDTSFAWALRARACHSNVSRRGISCLRRQGHGDSDTVEQVPPTASLQNSSSAASDISHLLSFIWKKLKLNSVQLVHKAISRFICMYRDLKNESLTCSCIK